MIKTTIKDILKISISIIRKFILILKIVFIYPREARIDLDGTVVYIPPYKVSIYKKKDFDLARSILLKKEFIDTLPTNAYLYKESKINFSDGMKIQHSLYVPHYQQKQYKYKYANNAMINITIESQNISSDESLEENKNKIFYYYLSSILNYDFKKSYNTKSLSIDNIENICKSISSNNKKFNYCLQIMPERSEKYDQILLNIIADKKGINLKYSTIVILILLILPLLKIVFDSLS